jgi:alkylation response protein AidB-like acyl-CoA dehydrogenase
MSYLREQAAGLSFQLLHIARLGELCELTPFTHADHDTVTALLETAADFAADELLPLAQSGDREGCQLHSTGVRLPTGTAAIYRHWCELGFPALGLPLEIEGLGLPRVVVSAAQELCDGANLAFGMLCINLRCAALAILKSGSDQQKARWLPGLCSGHIASTIVISEPQAGSDAGRITTMALPQTDGSYLLTGTKIWISYADHDATAEILHLVLARMPGAETGSRGLSLFAVPKTLAGNANGVSVLRLEHKMGLHASPTCVLEFQQASGELVGEPGKGLQALFVMMNNMRLAVAVQGAAVANAATLHAIAYAAERPQGGSPLAPPVNIIEHADVRRMLLEMVAESELMRATALRIAAMLDRAEALATPGDPENQRWQTLAELMLPVAKTYNAETAFTVANLGIQVMGGYGYTSDYPLERMARDIRVAAIYEGTSGIQALDFVKRKVVADQAVTLGLLLQMITTALQSGHSPFTSCWGAVHELVKAKADSMLAKAKLAPKAIDGGAYAMLQLTALALHCWNGHCLFVAADDAVASQQRLRAALTCFANSVTAKAVLWAGRCETEIPAFHYAK